MVKLKDFVCADITPAEFNNSTSPVQLPAFAIAVSAADKAYVILPLVLSEYVIAPFIIKVPSGFHTFQTPVEYVTVFDRFLAVQLESLTMSSNVALLPDFTLYSTSRGVRFCDISIHPSLHFLV